MKYSPVFFMIIFLVVLFSCNRNTGFELSEDEQESFLTKGENITKKGYEILSTELQQAILEEGLQAAIPYCHLKAVLLIDSVAEPYDVVVKRTSIRTRNYENEPDSLETVLLETYEKDFQAGKTLKPKVVAVDQHEALYVNPIYMKPQCLICHGTPGEEVSQETYDIILQYYPDDRATGFKSGDFRGMWTVRFERGD
jgi:hypothetical protein